MGYKKIHIHLVYDVNNYGHHNARLVSYRYITDIPAGIVYFAVVSFRVIQILEFLSEINKMEIWDTGIGNSYLEENTIEKVYIIAGTEFGDR